LAARAAADILAPHPPSEASVLGAADRPGLGDAVGMREEIVVGRPIDRQRGFRRTWLDQAGRQRPVDHPQLRHDGRAGRRCKREQQEYRRRRW
jgi:hypothetical protein